MSRKQNLKVEDVKKLATPDELELYSYVAEKAQKVAEEILDKIESSEADEGGIIFIEGPLSSGKTIVAAMVASRLSDNHVLACYQPFYPGRTDIKKDSLFSRSGVKYPATLFKTKADIEKMFHNNDVVVVDELHLVPVELQSFFMSELKQFRERGGWAVICSILFNSQGNEFVFVELIRLSSDKTYHLNATCQKCGSQEAYIGQRLINGKPTTIEDPEYISPSDQVVYEPRCKECFVYIK